MENDKQKHRDTMTIIIAILVVTGLVCLALGEYIVLLVLWGIGALLLKRAVALGVEPKDRPTSSR